MYFQPYNESIYIHTGFEKGNKELNIIFTNEVNIRSSKFSTLVLLFLLH